MKTADISKTRPNETKAWFRSCFTSSSQVTERAYSTALGVHMGPDKRTVTWNKFTSLTRTVRNIHCCYCCKFFFLFMDWLWARLGLWHSWSSPVNSVVALDWNIMNIEQQNNHSLLTTLLSFITCATSKTTNTCKLLLFTPTIAIYITQAKSSVHFTVICIAEGRVNLDSAVECSTCVCGHLDSL